MIREMSADDVLQALLGIGEFDLVADLRHMEAGRRYRAQAARHVPGSIPPARNWAAKREWDRITSKPRDIIIVERKRRKPVTPRGGIR
jgi:hypothetical protein